MAGSHPHRQRGSRVPARRASQLESPPVIESDLSAERAISHQELEAILRLLADEFEDFRPDAGRN
jgi:hypothetical protein